MKFLSFVLFSITIVTAVDINCQFKLSSWAVISTVYYCDLISDPTITLPNTVISVANGDHQMAHNHKKVEGFHSSSDSKTINFIPHGLSKIFPNLVAICIQYGRIKEIHQKDLEQYPKLEFLDLYNNDITHLEKDLFKSNKYLKLIYIHSNKISEIFLTIFDHLNQLQSLYLMDNICVSKWTNTRSGVLDFIEEIKKNCLNNFVLTVKQLVSNLESKLENITFKQREIIQMIKSNMTGIMKLEDINVMTKTHEQQEEMIQKFDDFKESIIFQFFFITLPLICLFAALNMAMIYVCCRKYAK